MPKSKRIFTKHNSTKFVLYTEGRDEKGEKIQQNCLVPVPYKHIPGNTLLISQLAGACGPEIQQKLNDQEITIDKSHSSKKKRNNSESTAQGPDLETILNQFKDSDEDWTSDDEDDYVDDSDSDEEETALKSKPKNLTIFQGPGNSLGLPSNVHVEVLEEGSEFDDEFGELGQFSDADFDSDDAEDFLSNLLKKSALTSSKVDCPENIKLLNEGFEKILAEYKDDQIGALDDEEICGTFSTDNEQMQNFINTPFERAELSIEIGQFDKDLKNKILEYSEMDEPEKIVEIVRERPLEWDCESILSTYSDKYNHPAVINEEHKIRKIKIPNNPLRQKLTRSQLRQLDTVSGSSGEEEEDDDNFSVTTSCNIRPKDETPEQRRERKQLFREAKKESRKLKKENKLAFKNEMRLQKSQAMNLKNNEGVKLV